MTLTAAEIRRRAPDGLRRDVRVREIDRENRTVAVAFASAAPVARPFGDEVLEISAQAIRLGRLEGGAAVLVNHDFDNQVGVVESVRIDQDAARAVLRFGKGARADEVFQDIADGIRRHVSVGYMIHAIEAEARDGQPDLIRVTDYEPFEISIVAVPADATVGVGRSASPAQPVEEKRAMNKQATPAPEGATTDEADRVAAVLEIGRAYGQDGLAARILREGGGAAEMQAELLRQMDNRGNRPLSDDGEIGMSNREVEAFSVTRLLRYLAEPSPETAKAAGLELEASRTFAQRSGREPAGAFLPPDLLLRGSVQRRDMTTGTAASGGALVGTDLLASSFIDLLRNRLSVVEAGARFLPGLVGNVAIPRLAGGASHEWLAEGAGATDSQPVTDAITMRPHTAAMAVPMTRRLILQSTPAVEDMVRADLLAGMARAIDGVALNGDPSADAPDGLRDELGAGALSWATAGKPTFGEIVELETRVASGNADDGALAYIYGAPMAGHLKTTVIDAGSGLMVEGRDGTVNGHRRIVSNQAAAGDVFFGNFQDVLIGLWSGLDIRADTATLAASDGLVLRGFQDLDIGIRHVESFALGENGP